MLPYILAGIAGLILLFLVVVALRPSNFRIARSATIAAPQAKLFGLVNDFHNWDGWSPWAKLDPNMTVNFDGPASGEGAAYSWQGNGKVGKGGMTITESRPSDLVRIRLEFLKPFKATNTTEFTFVPEGAGTTVNWVMTGTNNFFLKAFGLIMNMDKLIGADFEKGLAGMKSLAEGTA